MSFTLHVSTIVGQLLETKTNPPPHRLSRGFLRFIIVNLKQNQRPNFDTGITTILLNIEKNSNDRSKTAGSFIGSVVEITGTLRFFLKGPGSTVLRKFK